MKTKVGILEVGAASSRLIKLRKAYRSTLS